MQNIDSKDFICKILRNKELGVGAGDPDFSVESRKILILLLLADRYGLLCPQNIDSLGLTCKIFRNKELAFVQSVASPSGWEGDLPVACCHWLKLPFCAS